MAHAEKSVVIQRPAEFVFDFILDGRNNPSWRPSVTDVSAVPGTPGGVGAQWKQGMKGPGGRRIDADYRVVVCEKPRIIQFQVTAGPARPTGIYTLEAKGKSTVVKFVLDFQPKGLARLMDGMITKQMVVEVDTLDNLKAQLEAS